MTDVEEMHQFITCILFVVQLVKGQWGFRTGAGGSRGGVEGGIPILFVRTNV